MGRAEEEERDALFEFDAPQVYFDLNASTSTMTMITNVGESGRVLPAFDPARKQAVCEYYHMPHDPWFDRIHENHGLSYEPTRQRRNHSHSSTTESPVRRKRSALEALQHKDRIEHRGRALGHCTIQGVAAAVPNAVGLTANTHATAMAANKKPSLNNRGNKGRSQDHRDDDFSDLLAKHNQKFRSRAHTYEPREHGIQDIRQVTTKSPVCAAGVT